VGGSFDPQYATSVDLGCVTLSDRCFRESASLSKGYLEARRDACALLAPLVPEWTKHARDAVVIGTSGTIESVQTVLVANGFDSGPVTRDGVAALERAILERRWISDLSIPGLAPERVDIFPAGLAAVSAIFETLNIERIEFVDASLQHGLLYDLTARRTLENVQERTVDGWQHRFAVDVNQARRVRALALRLLDAVTASWNLESIDLRELLGWAADLHEIGLMVSARQPNRHGAYFVENGELPGFNPEERRAIAQLIRSHRGGFPVFAFASFPEQTSQALKRLAILLRLAVIFERTRTDADSPNVAIKANGDAVDVSVDAHWLDEHALSRAELDWERERLGAAGVTLRLAGVENR
jgi:exopolyphosphatase/guanosine-5'-triphosphate,3'-diphosphate pyrophosphatase